MQTYQATPDYYNDFIAHKDYKYIRKYIGPSGKTVYVYKGTKKKLWDETSADKAKRRAENSSLKNKKKVKKLWEK